jgi:hypothetical protein
MKFQVTLLFESASLRKNIPLPPVTCGAHGVEIVPVGRDSRDLCLEAGQRLPRTRRLIIKVRIANAGGTKAEKAVTGDVNRREGRTVKREVETNCLRQVGIVTGRDALNDTDLGFTAGDRVRSTFVPRFVSNVPDVD